MFGERLRAARELCGLSQKGVAALMSAAGHQWRQTTVSKTELAERPVSLDEAAELALIVGLELADLLPGRPAADPALRQEHRTLRAHLTAAQSRLSSWEAQVREAQAAVAAHQERLTQFEKEHGL